jgi:hypothetical protein
MTPNHRVQEGDIKIPYTAFFFLPATAFFVDFFAGAFFGFAAA